MKWSNLCEEQLNEGLAKTEEDAKKWFERIRVYPKNWRFEDGVVHCDSFHLYGQPGIKQLGVQFGTVTGDFTLAHAFFGSLKGSPKEVGGNFIVSGKEIRTLIGGPEKVHGDFIVRTTSLKDLTGGPTEVGGDLKLIKNTFSSLKGGPKKAKVVVIEQKNLSVMEFPEEMEALLLVGRISSLKGIQKYVRKCVKIQFDGSTVKEDIVGLTQIEGLKFIDVKYERGDYKQYELTKKAVSTINNFCDKGGKDFARAKEAQDALMDADLDDYASM